jgi:hypothetical protein
MVENNTIQNCVWTIKVKRGSPLLVHVLSPKRQWHDDWLKTAKQHQVLSEDLWFKSLVHRLAHFILKVLYPEGLPGSKTDPADYKPVSHPAPPPTRTSHHFAFYLYKQSREPMTRKCDLHCKVPQFLTLQSFRVLGWKLSLPRSNR